MNRTAFIRRTSPLLVTAALTCGWLHAAAAADENPPPGPNPKTGPSAAKSTPNVATPARVLETYRLQHTNPQFALEVIQPLLGGAREGINFSVDSRTSTLIVVAPREVQEKVAAVLKIIDVLAPVKNEEQIKVFTLVNVDPESAAKALKTVLPQNIRIAIDERARSLIATGSNEALNVAEAILTKLDENSRIVSHIVANYEVRVDWLASGLTGEDRGLPPADDLKDVVAELSRMGIKDPREVGQLVVQTMTSGASPGNFDVKGSPHFGDQMADFSASGILSELPNGTTESVGTRNGREVVSELPSGTLLMRVKISTRRKSPNEEAKSNEIATEIVLPLKQYVVLAAAPAGNETSVFVVQVVRAAKMGESKDKR